MNMYAGLSAANEASIGRGVAHVLSFTHRNLPNDVTERLRIARLSAVDLFRRHHRLAAAQGMHRAGHSTVALSGDQLSGWNWLASALPAIILVLGLLGISEIHDQTRAVESARVDVAILTDELPPNAYSDPGFIRFIKMHENERSTEFKVQ